MTTCYTDCSTWLQAARRGVEVGPDERLLPRGGRARARGGEGRVSEQRMVVFCCACCVGACGKS